MALGEIYVIKMHTLMFAEEMLNVFCYEQSMSDGTPGAPKLNVAFDSVVLLEWINTVHTSIDITALETFAIANPVDFDSVTPTNSQGTRPFVGGNRAPSWVAFSYKSNRAGAGTRSSYKRFAGILDEDVNANSLDSSFEGLAAVANLQDRLGNSIAFDGGNAFVPVQTKSGWIVGFPPVKNFNITSWQNALLSSQVSRKP